MSEGGCVFCKIASGEIAAQVVHRDDQVTAFRDLQPVAPTHVLVIPNRHVASPREAEPGDAALLGALLLAAAEVARQENLVESGYRIVINAGPDAGQTVDHLHVHVLGGRALNWPPG